MGEIDGVIEAVVTGPTRLWLKGIVLTESRCQYCGKPVEFRHIDGQVRTLHLYGNCTKVHSGSWTVGPAKIWTETSICSPTTCPKCRADVFFIRHNGGSAWFDELGHPWPKHACFADQQVSSDLDWAIHFAHHAKQKTHLGLVVKTMLFTIQDFNVTALAISLNNRTGICVRVPSTVKIVPGDVVIVIPLKKSKLTVACQSSRAIDAVKIEPQSIGVKPSFLKTGQLPGRQTSARMKGRTANPRKAKLSTAGLIACPKCGVSILKKDLALHYENFHPRN